MNIGDCGPVTRERPHGSPQRRTNREGEDYRAISFLINIKRDGDIQERLISALDLRRVGGSFIGLNAGCSETYYSVSTGCVVLVEGYSTGRVNITAGGSLEGIASLTEKLKENKLPIRRRN